MGVNFKIYKDAFLSRVKITEEPTEHPGINKQIVKSITENDPTFKYLISTWIIEPCEDVSGCYVEYQIMFEFNRFLYQSASSYFLDFLGNHTFTAFINQAENKLGSFSESEENVTEKCERSEQFHKKKQGLKQEVLIFEALHKLLDEGFISQDIFDLLQRAYEQDPCFSVQIHALFGIYDTLSLVEENRQKIIYHLKSALESSQVRNF